MKKLYFCAFFIVLFLPTILSAKPPKKGWVNGQLTFWNGTTLTGTLLYNWSGEVIMIQQSDERIQTFSAGQVRQFGWFDQHANRQRWFLSLTRQNQPHRPMQAFFELYMDGPLPIVRRLKRQRSLAKRLFTHPAYFADSPTMTPDNFTYYAYDDGHFLALDRFYREIYSPHLSTYDQELKQYVRNHRINDRTLHGQLLLIDRYNLLLQQQTTSASARQKNIHPY